MPRLPQGRAAAAGGGTEEAEMPRSSDAGRRDETPFRILVIGDFSSRAARGKSTTGRELGQRRTLPVDRDTLHALPGRLGVELSPPGGGEPLRLETTDDFRPEGLVERIPALRRWRDLRARLLEPRTAASAAEEARALFATGDGESSRNEAVAERPSPGPPAPPAGEGLLEALFEATSARTHDDDVAERLVQEVAGPGVEKLRLPRAPSDRASLVAAVDARLGAGLREVVLDPGFRAIEASWRGLEMVVRRVETSPELQIHVLDLSRGELAADVGVSGSLESSGLHRLLVEETVGTPDAVPWSLVVLDFSFDALPRDVAVLLRFAKLAKAAGAAVVAAADGRIVGCASLAETPDPEDWTSAGDSMGRDVFAAYRKLPEAASAALLWPPFLLRAPYGPGREETEGFPFDETEGWGGGVTPTSRALWGNPAYAAAVVFARAFSQARWDLSSALDPEIGDLPAWIVEREGEQELVPAVGAPLTSRAGDRIRAAGVIPLIPFRDQAAVRLGRLDSTSDPPQPLAGRWD